MILIMLYVSAVSLLLALALACTCYMQMHHTPHTTHHAHASHKPAACMMHFNWDYNGNLKICRCLLDAPTSSSTPIKPESPVMVLLLLATCVMFAFALDLLFEKPLLVYCCTTARSLLINFKYRTKRLR
jgi:hypothetical protein